MRAQAARSPLLAVCLGLLVAACYKGDEREKIPPPGYAGGVCDNGNCVDDSTCDPELGYCYFPGEPCYGFYCGGSDRGSCTPTAGGLPACACGHGWVNDLTPMYCCPDLTVGNMEIDPMCTTPPPQGSLGDDGETWGTTGPDLDP